jgi:hypothetical protein
VSLHEVCELYVICAHFGHVEVLCSLEGIFEKNLNFDHGYVTCLYVRSILWAMLVQNMWLSFLFYVSFPACCSAFCLFEKHMLAFVDLIHALQTRGRSVPN